MCGSLEQASEKRSALMGSPASQVVSGQLVCLLGNIVHQFFTSIYSDGSRDGINWALNEDKFSFLVMCSSHSKAVAFGEQIVLQTKCPSKLVWWVDANSLICQLRSDSFFDQMIIMLDGWLLHLRSEGKHCVREESHPSYSTPSVLGGVVLLIEQQVSTIILRFEGLRIGCALLLIRIFRTCHVQFIRE